MVTREQLIEQSVQTYVREQLFDVRGYPEAQIEIMDAFPTDRFDGPLDKNYLAAGYGFDDQGTQAELGSDLTVRTYSIEWFVFATTQTWGRNLAHAIKFALETDKIIPLLDISQAAQPRVGTLVVLGVTAEEVPVPDPEPAEENLWRTAVRVEDTYYPSESWF